MVERDGGYNPVSVANISYQPIQGTAFGFTQQDVREREGQASKASNQNEILFIGFNQDQTCITLGTQSGFKIYQADPLQLQLSRDLHGGIGIIEMLYRQNIMALVGGGTDPKWPKNKVIMWDDLEVNQFEEFNHNQDVEGVKMRPECVIVLFQNRIYLYGIPEFAIIGQIDTFQT